MLREEQIDLRRQRAKAGKFVIENLGKNRVFSDYRVSNPESGGQYTVGVRGFAVGDNSCTCPDFKANTLGTCKHIEAVLETLQADLPAHLRQKKAAVTRPEVYLHYGEQLQLGLHLPPRHSDKLAQLAARFFDDKGLWAGRGRYEELIAAVDAVPEEVTVFADALEFVDREVDRSALLAREREWLAELEAGTLDINLLPVPLYDYQTRGALFLACRGRSILGDDMGLGKCATAETPVFVNGTLMTAEDIWSRFAGPAVSDGEGEWADPTADVVTNALSWGDPIERMVPARVVRLYRQRVCEPIRKVILDDGSEIRITRRHRLLGRDGWTDRFAPGEIVCVPRTLSWDGLPADPDLVILLAWQIAEGHELADEARVSIARKDVARLVALRERAAAVGRTYSLAMNGMPISCHPGGGPNLIIHSRDYRRFLQSRGYVWGQLSAKKRIPDWIVAGDQDTAKLFLRHYFTAEGGVCRGPRSIEIASASRWLMLQLRTLLRRFGIWLRVARRMKRATNGTGVRREYHVGLLGGNAARLFRDAIGFDDPVKQAALEAITAGPANANVEGVPAADLPADFAGATGLPLRHLGLGTQYFYGTQNLSRRSARAAVAGLDAVRSGERLTAYRSARRSKWTAGTLTAYATLDPAAVDRTRGHLARLADRDVFYARVVSVTDEHHDGWVYDYEVEGRHNYVAGDVLCHNTIQTLAAVELLARERGVRRVLVVAPASVKYQWEGEIRRFTTRPVQVIDGGPDSRQGQYAEPTFYRLVNYEQVVRDLDAMTAWEPDVVVLDEAQRIKNWESKTSRAVKKLRSRYAMVLTGTPLENKLEELYSIVQFVDERRFGPAFEFLHEHRVLDDAGNLKGYRNLDRIREKLAPVFLRRTRAEVLTQLPERTDSTVFVELAPEQRAPYDDQKATLARLAAKSYLTDLDRKRILACLVNMRTICDSLFLFDRATRVSPKLDEFAELVPELCGNGHKAVVFSQWETMIGETAKVLDRLGIGYAVLTGGMSGKDRKAALDRFKTDPACGLFLSTDAGGTGLNLQAADTVVNLELPWNPAVLEQRIARAHRMGQQRPVRVVNFVTRDTIEERVLRTLGAKRGLFDGLFDGDGDEVAFDAVGRAGFADAVRELLGERPPEPAAGATAPAGPSAGPGVAVWHALIHLLDAAVETTVPPPDDVRDVLKASLRKLELYIDGSGSV